MNTIFIKVGDLFNKTQIRIDKTIQRLYEWSPMKIIGFIDSINESALSYKNDYVLNECKKDIGTILLFEVPSEERTDRYMHSYYLDEGNQRITSIIIIAKAIQNIAENYKLENNNSAILNQKNEVMLNYFIENAKNNFITENQMDEYMYLIESTDITLKKFPNSKIIKTYNAAVDEYKDVLENSSEEFNIITEFIVNEIGCNATYYRPTSLKVRHQKYNSLNTSIQEQTKLHRAFSTLSEMASTSGYDSFSSDVKKYSTIISNEYGLKSEKVLCLYYYIKCVNALDNYISTSDSSADIVALKVKTNERYSYEFFETFFDECEILCSLLSKRIKWDVIDTNENRKLGVLVAAIVDLFIKHPRQTTAIYFLKIIIECFEIKNKCVITGIKSFVNKQKLINLLTQIFIYKICIDCQASDNSAGDERSVYSSLIRENKPFSNEMFDTHFKHMKQHVDASMNTPMYSSLLYKLKYGGKGIRLILSIVASSGYNFNDRLRNFINIYYNFNEFDIDHIIPKVMGGKDIISNLRMIPKMDNRSENNFNNNERYIGNDTSFPENMRNMFFNESKYNERTFWMTQKVHEFINGLLDN